MRESGVAALDVMTAALYGGHVDAAGHVTRSSGMPSCDYAACQEKRTARASALGNQWS